MAKRETFAIARERLMREALALGWRVHRFSTGLRPLVTPYVELPAGEDGDDVRAYFKRQALYFSRMYLTEGRSSGLDIRGLSITDLAQAMRDWNG